MRLIRVHAKSIVLVLNRRQADALMVAVTPYANDPNQDYGGTLVLGKDTKDIKAKLDAAIAEVANG